MQDNDFRLKVEIAALHAWPGVEQELVMGWEARFAGGHTKRANSASPLPPLANVPEHVDACEAAYAEHAQPAIFKLPDFIDPCVDELLAARGYTVADPTLVMTRPLYDMEPDQVDPALKPDMDRGMDTNMNLDQWLPAWSACHGNTHLHPAHRMILETRLADAVYTCVRDASPTQSNGSHVSCGIGVVDHDLFGIFDVCTRADVRQRGHGSTLVRGLMAAGRRAGASTCYLQVVESNAPALALYRSLGFTTLYRYRYRVQPAS